MESVVLLKSLALKEERKSYSSLPCSIVKVSLYLIKTGFFVSFIVILIVSDLAIGPA